MNLKNDILLFKEDAQDILNDLAGQIGGLLKTADKNNRDRIREIESEEEMVREKIGKLDENVSEDRWENVKNEIKESLNRIRSDIDSI